MGTKCDGTIVPSLPWRKARFSPLTVGADQNLTCVPKVGMFQLHREVVNYTDAAEACEWEGGRLARVTSAERTNHLSAVVASLGNNTRRLHLAYVGMQDAEQEGSFVTSAGKSRQESVTEVGSVSKVRLVT